MLGLQRAAGNAAVQRLLMTAKEFQKSTSVSFAVRGSTVQQIDKLLVEYHQVRARGSHLQPGPTMDRNEQILSDLVQLTNFWAEDHGEDTSRSKKRARGIIQVHYDARRELSEAQKLRAAAKTNLVGGITGFEPAANKYVADRKGSASSILTYLGTAIGPAIPRPGDSVDFELSVKVPLDEYATSYIGLRIAAGAERLDRTTTKVNFESAVIGGANVAGLVDIGGELGTFLTAQGATPEQAMKLISYGWYRQLRESIVIPREVANVLWGGSTSSVGWKRAERWATNVEKETFFAPDIEKEKQRAAGNEDFEPTPLSSGVGSAATTDHFVRMGFLGGAHAAAGVGGIADIEGSIGIHAGKHYDRTSVGAGRRAAAKKGKKPEAVPRRGRVRNLATAFTTIDNTFSVSIAGFGGEISMSLELLARMGGKYVPEGYIAGFGTLSSPPLPINPLLLDLLSGGIKQLGGKLAAGVGKMGDKAKKEKGFEQAAPALDTAGGAAVPALATLGSTLDVASLASLGLSIVPQPVSLSVTVGIGYQIGKGLDGWTVDFSVNHSTGIDVDAKFAGLTLNKSGRLFRLVLAKDGGVKIFGQDVYQRRGVPGIAID